MTADGVFLVSMFVAGVLVLVALIAGAAKLRVLAAVIAPLAAIAGIVTGLSNIAISHGTSPIVAVGPALAITLAAAAVALAFRTRGRVAPAPQDAPLSGVSIAALVTVFFANVVGIVLGYLGLRDTAASTKRGRRLAQTALVLGWIGFVVSTVVASYLVWLSLYSAGVIRY